jgi:hypothetical protein
MDITIDMPDGRCIPIQTRYPKSCYTRVVSCWDYWWEYLCDNSPTDRPFPAFAIMSQYPDHGNRDKVGAFLHLVTIPSFQGDYLERISQGWYRWHPRA